MSTVAKDTTMRNGNNNRPHYKNNKKYKKGHDKKHPSDKKELKFAPVSKNGNFAAYPTVKEAYLRKLQLEPYKSKSILITAITNEEEPNFELLKPKRITVSWDADKKDVDVTFAKKFRDSLILPVVVNHE